MHARVQPANRFGAACRLSDIAADACCSGAARLAGAILALRGAAAAVMNLLGYDAVAVGNNEFDDGPSRSSHFRGGASRALEHGVSRVGEGV